MEINFYSNIYRNCILQVIFMNILLVDIFVSMKTCEIHSVK